MEVYMLFKHYKTKHDCQFPDVHYFTPENFVLMLKMCTANGALEEFKILNRDIMNTEKIDDDYVAQIKKGYSTFISQRNEVDNKSLIPQSRRVSVQLNSENLVLLKSLLLKSLE
jgi:hypothetical protein